MTLTGYSHSNPNSYPQGRLINAAQVIYLLNNRFRIYNRACLASDSKYSLEYYRAVLVPNHKINSF